MEKRYQVFISSTFQDLQGARQEVSQALLRADCFPAGMELFPAADEEQFEFIKTVIDQSDYYILISAGRYGSIHPETGLSYTEMEYDYAVETGKPVIRLLHKDPFNELKGEFIEQTDEGREKLKAFRNKLCKGKLVAFWKSPSDLKLEMLFALQDAKKRSPTSGWVLGTSAASDEVLRDNLDLREKVLTLERALENEAQQGAARLKALCRQFDGDLPKVETLISEIMRLVKRPGTRFSRHNFVKNALRHETMTVEFPHDADKVFDALIYDEVVLQDSSGFFKLGPIALKTSAWSSLEADSSP